MLLHLLSPVTVTLWKSRVTIQYLVSNTFSQVDFIITAMVSKGHEWVYLFQNHQRKCFTLNLN